MPALTGERKRNLASRETLFEEASYCSRKVHANVVEEILGVSLECIIHANCECGCHCKNLSLSRKQNYCRRIRVHRQCNSIADSSPKVSGRDEIQSEGDTGSFLVFGRYGTSRGERGHWRWRAKLASACVPRGLAWEGRPPWRPPSHLAIASQ